MKKLFKCTFVYYDCNIIIKLEWILMVLTIYNLYALLNPYEYDMLYLS